MTDLGYDKPLYILPFDHRGSFQTKMFGWKGALTAAANRRNRRCQAGDLRRLQGGGRGRRTRGKGRHPGGRAVRLRHPSRRVCASLHTAVLRPKRAGKRNSISNTARILRSTSKPSSQPSRKVLVRYNPAGDHVLNARQAGRLKRLSDYLHGKNAPPVHVRTAGPRRRSHSWTG